MNILHCIKLDKDLEGLERAPYPGELGKKILKNVLIIILKQKILYYIR